METGYCLGFCERIQTNRARYVLLKVFQERLHSKIIILFVYYDGNRIRITWLEVKRKGGKRGGEGGGGWAEKESALPFSSSLSCFSPLPSPSIFRLPRRLKGDISEFTQQDGRKRRTSKRLFVTHVTGLLLACFVV